jgi:hypothetical protein
MGRGFWSPLYGGMLDETHDGTTGPAAGIGTRLHDYQSYNFPIASRVIGIIGITVTGTDG